MIHFSYIIYYFHLHFLLLSTIYSFRTQVDVADQHMNWVMNSSDDCLESRMEVQFFDKYDLLGLGNKDPLHPEKGRIVVIIIYIIVIIIDIIIIISISISIIFIFIITINTVLIFIIVIIINILHYFLWLLLLLSL